MKTKVITTIALLVLFQFSLSSQSEEKRIAFEVNGGLSLSLNLSGDPVTNFGAGAEVLIHYRLTNHFGLYGGWGYNAFRNDYATAVYRCNFEETGYIIGMQYKRLIEASNLSVFVRGAYQYKHIEIEDTAGELLFDTAHGSGLQAGFGIDLPLTAGWSLLSEIKFNALPERKNQAVAVIISDRNYLSLRLGILRRF
jgi:hypothetical protein